LQSGSKAATAPGSEEFILHLRPKGNPELVASVNDLVGASVLLGDTFSQMSGTGGATVLQIFNLLTGSTVLLGNLLPLISKERFHHISRYLKIAGGVSLIGSGINFSPSAKKLFRRPTILTGVVVILTTVFDRQIQGWFKTRLRRRTMTLSHERIRVRQRLFMRKSLQWDEVTKVKVNGEIVTFEKVDGRSLTVKIDPERSSPDIVRSALRRFSSGRATLEFDS